MADILPLSRKRTSKGLAALRADRAARDDRASILQTLDHPSLLGPFFSGPSWDGWRTVLRATFGLPMSTADRARFRELAGRDPPPGPVREAWWALGRRAGKDSICSAIATHCAVFGGYEKHVRPGERPTILLLASTKEQATGLLGYIKGYFEQVAVLSPLVRRVTAELVELSNGVDIIVSASNYRSLRGRTVAVAIFNEVAFWRDESGRFTNPDSEIYSAVLPSLMTLRSAGSLLIGISSVHRKIGLLYDKVSAFEGQSDDNVLAIRAPSRTFNSTLDEADISADMALDPAKGLAEWESIWRTDLSSYIDRSLVERLIDKGEHERDYNPQIRSYTAFSDEAGGSGQDASALVIVHTEKDGQIIQDLARRWAPPFSPSDVVAEKARLLKTFRIGKVVGDRWAGGIPPEMYQRHGIRFEQSAKPKGELYTDFLHILNSSKIRLLDNPVQLAELCNLERRVAWGGRESIDHSLNGHDDLSNALAGAATLAATVRRGPYISPEAFAKAADPHRPRLQNLRAARSLQVARKYNGHL